MNKSLLAISTLASLAGLVALGAGTGCSDDATTQTSTAATEPADGGPAAPPKTVAPPENPDDGDDSGSSEPQTCMDTKPFDTSTVPYHSPAVKAGSCTTADVKLVDDYIRDNPQTSVEDLQAAVTKQSKRCSDCVFGASDDEKWAPIVSDGSSATVNGAGCVAVVSGKDDCGKTYAQWNTCLNEVCASCTEQSENAQCKNDAQQGPCGDASKALFKACGKNVNDYLQKCFSAGIGTVVEKLCGPATKDGGA